MTAARHVAVDARALWVSGIGRYTREVTARLIRRGTFADVTLFGDPETLRPWLNDEGLAGAARIVPLAGGVYSLRSQLGWRAAARTRAPGTVTWFPHWDIPVAVGLGPAVVTIHDLIHLHVPESASPWKRFVANRMIRLAAHRAAVVTVDSAYTRADLLRLAPDVEAKVRVVGGGVAAAFHPGVAAPTGVVPTGARYLLVMGNRKPHKNLAAAVRVLARLRGDDAAWRLVVAGTMSPHWAGVLELARTLGVHEAIVDVGQVPDAELASLYAGAACLLFPSRYEGFGLPVAEAMACGTPVVAANAASVPEVAGGAADLCAPDDVDAMTAAVLRVTHDAGVRRARIDAGRAAAARFTWDAAAQALADALRDSANEWAPRDSNP